MQMCRMSKIWTELPGIFILQTIQKSAGFGADLVLRSAPKSHWLMSSAHYGHGQTDVCADLIVWRGVDGQRSGRGGKIGAWLEPALRVRVWES